MSLSLSALAGAPSERWQLTVCDRVPEFASKAHITERVCSVSPQPKSGAQLPLIQLPVPPVHAPNPVPTQLNVHPSRLSPSSEVAGLSPAAHSTSSTKAPSER